MPTMTPLPLEFKDLLRSLNERGVEYLVVGGWAVIHYGYVRYTGDFDLWIAVSSENADRLILALNDFIGTAPDKRSILTLRKTIEFGVPPLRVHIMCNISGVKFDECIKKKVETDWEGIPVAVIGFDDLLTNKGSTGRLKDAADVEWLSKVKRKSPGPIKRKRKK